MVADGPDGAFRGLWTRRAAGPVWRTSPSARTASASWSITSTSAARRSPGISGVLRDARLVRERRDGRNRIYELRPRRRQSALRAYFDQFWTDAAGRLQARGRATDGGGSRQRLPTPRQPFWRP